MAANMKTLIFSLFTHSSQIMRGDMIFSAVGEILVFQ